LLDTCTLLWFLSNDPKLIASARAVIEDPANVRWVSPGSLFEIAIKVRIGKLRLFAPYKSIFPTKLLAADIHLLPLEPGHIEPLTTLPFHHRDPFDRLIAATALVEGLTLVSADRAFDVYGVNRLW
jgi:PIN domain nuclease of toxin-antitoxin system